MDEFLFCERDWLYKQFLHIIKTEGYSLKKYTSLKIALNLFLQNNGKLIVETGTQRMKDDGGGSSTTFFGAFCKRYNKYLVTVDNDKEHLEISRKLTKEYEDYITYILKDSIEFLNNFNEPIDLLYLDSMDCPSPPEDAINSQIHQLNEVKAIIHKMRVGSLILLDDNDWENGGKTRLAKQFLLGTGDWRCIIDREQSLWERIR